MFRIIIFPNLEPFVNALIDAELTGAYNEVSDCFSPRWVLIHNSELDCILHVLNVKVKDLVPVGVTAHFFFNLRLLYFLWSLIFGSLRSRSIFHFNIIGNPDKWVHLLHQVQVLVELAFFYLNCELSFCHLELCTIGLLFHLLIII